MRRQSAEAPREEIAATARRPRRVALVLQGGGALGAYQAGVYQAMDEHGLTPDWVVGTSIGAINAALIAGNAPGKRVERLRAFWDRVSHPDFVDPGKVLDAGRRWNAFLNSWDATARGVPGFFQPRPFNPFAAGLEVPPELASFYDTAPLAATLAELTDAALLGRPDGMRLTVSATQVTSGRLVHFDTRRRAVGIPHVMASGALPPGLPPVRIDGELYWDGGLYSNTPLEAVLDDEEDADTLCFMVDLWSADGPEPQTLEAVQTRQKDLMYASRSERHIEDYLRTHRLQRMVRMLRDRLPAGALSAQERHALESIGGDTTLHIVRLAYGGRDWQMSGKDVNFSAGSIDWRWRQGYDDAQQALRRADWLAFRPDEAGVVVHQVGIDGASALAGG
ncbi:MAG: patatin-like phospholipase family protein [Burkholderiaceae bacterium]